MKKKNSIICPKTSKDFLCFLNKDEKRIVLNNKDIYSSKVSSTSFLGLEYGEIKKIDCLTKDINPHIKKMMRNKLFKKFKLQVFLNDQSIAKQSRGETRDWIFDVRSFVLDTKNVDLIFDAFWEIYKNQYPFQITAETLAGGLTAQLLSLKAKEKGFDLNCFLVREERKTTGLQKNIEGKIQEGIPVIIVDDFFNSGGTITYLIEVLKKNKCKLASLFVFVDYQTSIGKIFLEEFKINLQSLFTLSDFGIETIKSVWHRNQIKVEPAWDFKSKNPSLCYSVPKSTPAQDKDSVYFGTDEGIFYALNKYDGSIKWSFETGEHTQKKGIFSCPVIFKNMVYFGAYDGNFYALDTKTGKVKWKFCDADWIGSSPSVSEKYNLVFVGLEFSLEGKKGGVISLNALTGEKVWEDFFDDYVHCSPTYSEELGVVIIGSNCGYVKLYDAQMGQIYWKYDVGSEVKSSFVFDAEKGMVCFGAFDGKEYILNVLTGRLILAYKTQGLIYSAPLIYDNVLFFTSTDKNIYGLGLNDLNLQCKFLASGKILSSPVLWGNYVVFGSNDGRVYFIDFFTKKLYYLQFTERITNRIIFDEKQCYISLYNNNLFVFDLKKLKKELR